MENKVFLSLRYAYFLAAFINFFVVVRGKSSLAKNSCLKHMEGEPILTMAWMTLLLVTFHMALFLFGLLHLSLSSKKDAWQGWRDRRVKAFTPLSIVLARTEFPLHVSHTFFFKGSSHISSSLRVFVCGVITSFASWLIYEECSFVADERLCLHRARFRSDPLFLRVLVKVIARVRGELVWVGVVGVYISMAFTKTAVNFTYEGSADMTILWSFFFFSLVSLQEKSWRIK